MLLKSFFDFLLLKSIIVGAKVIRVRYLYEKVLMHLVANLPSYYPYFLFQSLSFLQLYQCHRKVFL